MLASQNQFAGEKGLKLFLNFSGGKTEKNSGTDLSQGMHSLI